MPVSKLMSKFDGGGNRNLSQFSETINDIKNNGVESPIIISNETGKIVDGNHRLFIANELGIKNVPVKFIDSSNEIDGNKYMWYPNLEEGTLNDGERERVDLFNDKNRNEQIYNSRSITSSRDTTTSSTNNQLYNEIQKNDNRPSITSSDSIRNSTTKELDNSSFSYDIDEDIIKRVNGGRLQLPTFGNSSINNNSTNNQQSQIAPLFTNSNMQETQNNAIF